MLIGHATQTANSKQSVISWEELPIPAKLVCCDEWDVVLFLVLAAVECLQPWSLLDAQPDQLSRPDPRRGSKTDSAAVGAWVLLLQLFRKAPDIWMEIGKQFTAG